MTNSTYSRRLHIG